MFHADRVIIGFPRGQDQPKFGKGMLFLVKQAFVGKKCLRMRLLPMLRELPYMDKEQGNFPLTIVHM